MKIIKCDGCKKIINTTTNNNDVYYIEVANSDLLFRTEHYDLCYDCYNKKFRKLDQMKNECNDYGQRV